MASLAQLEQALIGAHQTGNTDDARILAAEIVRIRNRKPAKRSEPKETIDVAKWSEENKRSSAEESGFIENVLSGFGSGLVTTGELAALGGAALLEEDSELAAREKIQAAAEAVRPEGGDQDALSYQISSGLGSVAGTLGAAAAGTFGAGVLGAGAAGAGIAGLATAGAVGIGAGAGEASERARAAGATEEERNAATFRGAVIGSLEVLPLARILKIPGATKLAKKIGGKSVKEGGNRIRSALTTGGAEAAQEATAAFLQNLNERGYNAEKELLDSGIIDEAIAGGGAGVIIQAVADFFIRGKPERLSATESTKDTTVGEEAETLAREAEATELGAEVASREAEVSALEAQALEAADRDDETAFDEFDQASVQAETAVEQTKAEAAQPDMFTRELREAREAAPEEALRGQLESQGAEQVPQRESITEPAVAPAQPTPVQEDMIDRLDTMEVDDAEIAEIESLLQADAVAESELDAIRGRSQLESLDSRREGDRKKASEEKRYSILQQTIEDTPTRNYNTLSKNFEKRLKAEGIEDVKATKDETKTIRSAVNVQRAERPDAADAADPPEVTPPPEATQLEGMEAQIPERTDKSVIPSQMSFPGMGRRKPPPVKETPPAPNTITKEFMDGLGIAPKAPIRKRTEGKDLNDPVVREQFVALANNKKVAEQTRLNVARSLEGVPEAQLELFQPKPRKRASAKGETNASTGTTESTPSGVSVPVSGPPVGTQRGDTTPQSGTEVSESPRGGGVASARSSVGDPVRGEGAKQTTLVGTKPKAKPKAKPKSKDSDTSSERKVAEDKVTARFKKESVGVQEVGNRLTFPKTVGEKEPITVQDLYTALTVLDGPAKARDKVVKAVKTYLSKVPRISDGLMLAIYDVANQSTQFRTVAGMAQSEIDFYQGTGRVPAQRVLDWAKDNLSADVNKWIEETLNTERAVLFSMQHETPSGSENPSYLEKYEKRQDLAAAKAKAIDDQMEAETRQEFLDDKKEISELLPLTPESVTELDSPLHPGVRGLLGDNNLKQALLLLAGTSPSTRVSDLARKLASVAGDTKVEVVKDLQDAGSFDPKTNTIRLNSEIGMNPHVLLHEMSHAATAATLDNPNNSTTKQLNKLFEDVKDYLDTAYGAKDLKEFAAEAQSNPEFRAKLAQINPKGESNALQRLNNIIGNFLRRLVGMKPKKLESAQTIADDLIDSILAPAPKYRNANELAMDATTKGVKGVMDRVGAVQKAVSQPPLTAQGREKFGDMASNLMSSAGEAKSWLIPKLLDAQALADTAYSVSSKLGDVATKFYESADFMRGEMGDAYNKVREQIKIIDKWHAVVGQEGQKHLDDLIYSEEYGATIYQVDPTKPFSDYEGKTDESGNDLGAVWKAQRKDWKALGADGQKAYRTMRDMYRAQFKELKAVIDGRIDRLLKDNPAAATELKSEVFAKLFENKALDVYFPLLREGRYKIEYSFKNAKDGRDTYVFQMMDSKAQRDRLAEELRADPEVIKSSVKTGDGDFTDYDFNNAPSTSFVGKVIKVLDANGKTLTGAEKQSYAESKADIMNLFIDALPESSFAKSLQRRKGTPGYMTDSVYAMKTKGFDLARQVVKLKYTAQFQQLEAELAEVRAKPPQGADYKFNQIGEQLQTRIEFAKYGARNKGVEEYVRFANQTAFVWTLGGNIASAAVQLFQMPMFVFPMLGARYGYQKTYDEIMSASDIVTGARMNAETIKEATGIRGKLGAATKKISIAHGLDSYYDITDNGDFVVKKGLGVPDARVKELERIAPLVQLMYGRGHLNRSFIFDQLGLQEGGRAAKRGGLGQSIANGIDFGTGASALVFNQSERYNRQVTAVAAYNLALERVTAENPKMPLRERQDRAAVDALYDTQEYNGGSTLETAPRIAQEGLGRVALMYKTYGLRMYYNMFKTMGELKNTFVEAKKAEGLSAAVAESLGSVAMRQMIGIHGSALFFSGVHGIPLYGAMQVLSNLFLDDEEDDFDTIVRNYIGEGWYKGPFNQVLDQAGVGADVSSRIRLTGLLIQENRYNTEPSPEEFLGFYLGGPAFSIYKRLNRGITDIGNGEYERGIESVLPTAISNGYKALNRYQRDEGIYSRRVDPIYDDMTGGELFAQFFGFAPAEYIRIQEENQRVKRIDSAVSDKRSKLTKKMYIAMRMGDWDEIARIDIEIGKFNSKHPSFSLSKESIIKSLKQHIKTSETMHNGVVLSPAMRRLAQDHVYGVRNGFTPPNMMK